VGSTVGLPRMHKEAGERRDFLPRLVGYLERAGASKILLEEGYGSGIDVEPGEYLAESDRVGFATYEECFEQDVVVVLRCPAEEAIRSMEPGSFLVSMIHYPTRPERVRLLRELGVHAVSLDSVTDDEGARLVEDRRAVGWNGVFLAEVARVAPAGTPIRAPMVGRFYSRPEPGAEPFVKVGDING